MTRETHLEHPLDLPCGVQLKNRLIKSAMSDSLGDGAGNPTPEQVRLYERWADGGVGLSIIGEVQITPDYPEKPGNLVLTAGADMKAFRDLAAQGSKNGAHIWPQLGHAGALAFAALSAPKGPSALSFDELTCGGMTVQDIRRLPREYAAAAHMAKDCGFGGVQIHAGHGFLLSQFLSPLFNRRTDAYGGNLSKRYRIVGEIVDAVRAAVGPGFPIGIKINSSDLVEGGLTQEDAFCVVRMLGETSVDLIDISGGTYFPSAISSSENAVASSVYFAEFARRAKAKVPIPIALTGGFKTRAQAMEALSSGAADAISVARGMVLDPCLASNWITETGRDPAYPIFEAPPSGGVTAWYTMRLSALAGDAEASFDMDATEALVAYNGRDLERVRTWRARFGAG